MNAIKKEIHEVLHSTQREEWAIEGELQIALSLAIIKNMDVYIWGGGEDTWSVISFFRWQGIEPIAIISNNKERNGSYINHTLVMDCDTFCSTIKNPENTFVFVWTYAICLRNIGITKVLKCAGVEHFFLIPPEGRFWVVAFRGDHACIEANRPEYYLRNENEILDLVDLLEDDRSLLTLKEYLRSYMEHGYYRGENLPTKYKYFFDKDGKSLFKHLDDEVWINCGANYGDTIFTFYSNRLKCKKIYAVEADKKVAIRLKENIDLLPDGEADKITIFHEEINELTNWNQILDEERVTLVNADIEGSELALLKSLKSVILRDRPVLSICVYHKKEDIIEVPRYLKETVSGYVYFLRKYACWQPCYRGDFELVLYAVPNERAVADRGAVLPGVE